MSKISVIVPVYNVENYLERCVLSLLNQIFDDYDIILVDDGSKDGSPAMCDRYAAEYEKVRAYHKENGGLGSARNYGVSVSESEYISFVDSDDYVEPKYLQDLYDLLQKDGSDLSSTLILRENEKGQQENPCPPFQPFSLGREEALLHFYSGKRCGWEACGKLIKRTHLLENPFPRGIYEDVALMYKILNRCDRVSVADCRKNYHYIVREGSLLSNRFSEKNYRAFEICDEFSGFIDKEYPQYSFLIPIMYKRFLVVIFNLSTLEKKTFNELFYKYRPLFRSNYRAVKKCEYVSFKDRMYFLLLCSTPSLYRAITRITGKRKGR